jgi:hypothetical protein
MSALPPIAIKLQTSREVRFVPISDSSRTSRHFRKVPRNEPALAGGRWRRDRAHCVYRSNHLIERR